MPPQKTNAKKNVAAKAAPTKQKKVVVKEASDEDDDDDDENIEEDDDDESLESLDEDEELDDEDGSDDLDEEGDEDDEDEDDEDEEEIVEKPAKKAKLNGKDETPAKPAKKDEAKKAKQEAKAETKADPEEKFEERASAIGPLTEKEKEMFAANFRAMSATSIFVGKLPDDTTDEDLKKLHPSIRSIRRPVSRKGLPATFGFLNFASKETADRALADIRKKGAVKIRGQEVLVNENGNGQCHPPSTVDRRKLRIYGCPKFVTAETIKKSLPGCVDVLLGDKDKGNSIEAVAVFRTSAETQKILLSRQTLTLNECVCALFYLNISHNVKQHERKKDRKQQQKKQNKDEKADPESDDQDDSDLPADKVIKFKKENVKPKVQSAKKNKKRPAPDDSDDDGDAEEEPQPTPKNKKVSLKSPQKTPVSNIKAGKKTPMRKGTPFKKAKTAA